MLCYAMLHKGHVPAHILDCKAPMLALPPDNLFNVQTDVKGKRQAFALCMMYKLVNDMAADYKRRFCPKARAA